MLEITYLDLPGVRSKHNKNICEKVPLVYVESDLYDLIAQNPNNVVIETKGEDILLIKVDGYKSVNKTTYRYPKAYLYSDLYELIRRNPNGVLITVKDKTPILIKVDGYGSYFKSKGTIEV